MAIVNAVIVDRERTRKDSYRAFVRLMGVLTGTFRCRVLPSGRRVMYLPGGYWDAEAGKIREPLAIFRDGKFVNKEVKESIHALAQLWWAVHVRGEEAKGREHLLPLVPFVDKGWTQETTIFVRPLSYVPREKAEAEGRPWDAGSAEVVLRDGDDEIRVRIYIRRRENGLEAALPKWVVPKKDMNKFGEEVELKEYYSKLHFNAGGGNIDGSVLASVTLLWAWYFQVPEPLLDRTGKCATCRFLTWRPEDKGLWEKDNPISCRWFCTRRIMYIDENYAKSEEARDLYWRGLEQQAARVLDRARFEFGCDLWESTSVAGFGSLSVKGRSKIYERPVVDGRLDGAVKRLKEPVVYFDAPGFHDPEFPSASIPEVRVWVRPLIEGAPKRDYWKEGVLAHPSRSNNTAEGGVNPPSTVITEEFISDVPF